MVPANPLETGLSLLFCFLIWAAFSAACYLADKLKRPKNAMVAGLIAFLCASVIMLLASYASVVMQTGILMSFIFQLTGILLSVMAASRIVQLLSWPRTWLAGSLALLLYLIIGLLAGWSIAAMPQL